MSNRLVEAINILAHGNRARPSKSASKFFEDRTPAPQNIVDIFDGEWSSHLPGLSAEPGNSKLFDDPRIRWMMEVFQIEGKNVIELGPLEAAHTQMMSAAGAKSVTAIEGNQRAFLKCLCVKELFRMDNVKFMIGDFSKYLEETKEEFDVAVASGVLYHMADPISLLSNLCRISRNIFLWTHFFDETTIRARQDSHLFQPSSSISNGSGHYEGSRKIYAEQAINWAGFTGGISHHATWLTKEALLNFFNNSGYSVEVAFEELEHPNGPSIAICARRMLDHSPYPIISSQTLPREPPQP